MALVIKTDHPLYRRAARREAATWGRPSVAALRAQRPTEHPIVREFHRSLIIGCETPSTWVDWVVEKYGPFRNALSIGCGAGIFEEEVLSTGAVARLHVVDLSPEAVRSFQNRLNERGVGTHVTAEFADLNEVIMKRDAYDLVIARTSLHHLINIEQVLEQVRSSLEDNGIFLVHDFVGPNVWQWLAATLDEVNRFIESTCNEFPSLSFNVVRRPNPQAVKAVSPFESVRSGEIVEILRAGFDAEREVLTDRLLFVLLNYGIAMTDWDDPELNKWLELAVARERELSSQSDLPACTLWGIYRPGAAAIDAAVPWTAQEIKQRIGVSRISVTKLALSVIDRLPWRDQIVRFLVALKRKMGWY